MGHSVWCIPGPPWVGSQLRDITGSLHAHSSGIYVETLWLIQIPLLRSAPRPISFGLSLVSQTHTHFSLSPTHASSNTYMTLQESLTAPFLIGATFPPLDIVLMHTQHMIIPLPLNFRSEAVTLLFNINEVPSNSSCSSPFGKHSITLHLRLHIFISELRFDEEQLVEKFLVELSNPLDVPYSSEESSTRFLVMSAFPVLTTSM